MQFELLLLKRNMIVINPCRSVSFFWGLVECYNIDDPLRIPCFNSPAPATGLAEVLSWKYQVINLFCNGSQTKYFVFMLMSLTSLTRMCRIQKNFNCIASLSRARNIVFILTLTSFILYFTKSQFSLHNYCRKP